MTGNLIQCVILAGGKGTRLQPITYEMPKVMVDINGSPFLQYLLELLKTKGLSKILLLVSYLGEQIEDYFGDGKSRGLDISYSYEDTPLGTGGALKKAEKLIESEFLLINGDTYLDFDYEALNNKFKSLNCMGLICAYVNKNKTLKSNLYMIYNNKIMSYNKVSSKGMTAIDAGVSIFKKEVLELIPPGRRVSFENLIYKKLIQRGELYGFPVENAFLDIGSFEKLQYARKVLR